MGVTQPARSTFQTVLVTGNQQQIKTTRRQALSVNRTDTGRCAGNESSTLGLGGTHENAPGTLDEGSCR
jgi:hypothetical protein